MKTQSTSNWRISDYFISHIIYNFFKMKRHLNLTSKWKISEIVLFLTILLFLFLTLFDNVKILKHDPFIVFIVFLIIIAIFKNFKISKFGKWLNKKINLKFKYIFLYILLIFIYMITLLIIY